MNKAFTLIELLIVVAIIAILAAIAVPNFLEAQTRAKVSRVKADLRTMATGLESYVVDYNKYPFCDQNSFPFTIGASPQTLLLERLSTPVSYLSQGSYPDPFRPRERRTTFSPATPEGSVTFPTPTMASWRDYEQYMKYVALQQGVGLVDYARSLNGSVPNAFCIYSGGPRGYYPGLGTILRSPGNVPEVVSAQFYDPTNGSISYGTIYRVGGTGLDASAAPSSLLSYGAEFFRQAYGK